MGWDPGEEDHDDLYVEARTAIACGCFPGEDVTAVSGVEVLTVNTAAAANTRGDGDKE